MYKICKTTLNSLAKPRWRCGNKIGAQPNHLSINQTTLQFLVNMNNSLSNLEYFKKLISFLVFLSFPWEYIKKESC